MREIVAGLWEFFMTLWSSIVYYSVRLFSGFHVKALISMLLVFFTDVLYGDVFVFAIFFVLVSMDLVLGVLRAKLDGTYQFKFLLYWVRKVITYLVLVLVFGLMCQALSRTAGVVFSAVDWLLFCCSITEVTSIINNMRRLGCPVPVPVDMALSVMQGHAMKHFDRFCGVSFGAPPSGSGSSASTTGSSASATGSSASAASTTSSVPVSSSSKLEDISYSPEADDSPPRDG